MTETPEAHQNGSPEQPLIQSTKRRVSPVWIVPLVSILVGVWLGVDYLLGQGPEVIVTFESASGIEADKTLIKYRDVAIGVVQDVELSRDHQLVEVRIQMKPTAKPLLRKDTQFWVVRPMVRGTTVQGLGTLLSGAYLELSPGAGPPAADYRYVGLDARPEAPAGTPGKRVVLVANGTRGLSVGSPVLFQGYRVGTVESSELQLESKQMRYSLFVEAPYDKLITTGTRFWAMGAVEAEMGPDGIDVSIAPLLALLTGGVAFDTVESGRPQRPSADGALFELHSNRKSAAQVPYQYHARFVVEFKQSLRGLNPGAPVRYRGINVGSVERLMLTELVQEDGPKSTEAMDRPIPVLIQLEPGRLEYGDDLEGVRLTKQLVDSAIERGLRATLESGSLLTGDQFIGLDFYPKSQRRDMRSFEDHRVIPTVPAGLDHLQVQVGKLLDKINSLPLENTVQEATGSLVELKGTLAAARTVVENDQLRDLPGNLQQSLDELNRVLKGFSADSKFQRELLGALTELKHTLQGVQGVTDQLEESPNSVVFEPESGDDPEPKAPR